MTMLHDETWIEAAERARLREALAHHDAAPGGTLGRLAAGLVSEAWSA
jgi:hypothetical protein